MYRYNFDSAHVSSKIANLGLVSDPSCDDEKQFDEDWKLLRCDVIGNWVETLVDESNLIKSPVDQKYRRILYADYTASGRSLRSVETFIIEQVLPWYGNTHSVASGTARRSTYFREEARHVIRNYFNCTEANSVIFTGAGVTAAVAKLVAILEIAIIEGGIKRSDNIQTHSVEDRWGSLICSLCNVRVKNEHAFRSHCFSPLHCSRTPPISAPSSLMFFIDAHNHHSAMLPFRELATRHNLVVRELPLGALPEALRTVPANTVPVCVLSAMSNITGQGPEDMYALNVLIHEAGGIACWDLATFTSHKRFDMTGPLPSAHTDFAFVSSHKLIGGPGAAGLLLARREWLRNTVPSVPGGGVVFYASPEEQSYIQNSEHREEAGTPDIVGCIRAGLVFALHEKLDWHRVELREISLANRLMDGLKKIPKVIILNTHSDSPIISMSIEYNSELFFHPNFIVTLLNDLFGVQARAGCACAGPYAQSLLGLTPELTHEFHVCLQKSGQEIFRPGFVRVSLHWTMTEAEVDTIATAIEWIARNGHKALPHYQVDLATGEWHHRNLSEGTDRVWLSDFQSKKNNNSVLVQPLEDLIRAADEWVAKSKPMALVPAPLHFEYTHLVWFVTPSMSEGPMGRERIIHPRTSHEKAEVLLVEEDSPALPAKPISVPRKLRALTSSALIDYSMINPGDRVLVGLSGGKDSLSLLHILIACQKRCPFKFDIAAATVDPQVAEYQPGALIPYVASLGIEYHYLSQPIMEIAKTAMTGRQSICAFCSRMKRGMLYTCMRKNGYNVLALGQHLDDLVESFLMSCFRNGSLRTMKANYFVTEKDLRVIRPLIYVREKMTDEFAKQAKLPIIRDNCPACFAAPKERHRIKLLLSNEEFQNNHLFASMLQCMKPLIGITSAEHRFNVTNCEEEDDQAAEETLLPCSDAACPLPK